MTTAPTAAAANERAAERGTGQRLGALLDALDLDPARKELLRQRWLDQVVWTSRQARKAHGRYLWVRLPVVIGGVAIPGLLTILLSAGTAQTVPWLLNVPIEGVRLITFVTSLTVAILSAVEEVLHYADRWHHYRRTSELLKTLGWQYLALSGAFRHYASHAEAYAPFAERVEDVLNEDVEGYLGAVANEQGTPRTKHEVIV
jgi:hypothetical protein